ncbi:hypothetical protein [Flavobacterium sp.]|uniref:hypothetical protein n=1 Tax=Flavobacterium sp. TaxID=239 RepID=UPI003267801B
MIFEIPYNEKTTRSQAKLLFDLHWKSLLKKNNVNLYIGLILILLGISIVVGQDNLGYIFVAGGIHYLINFVNYLFYYRKTKKKYFDLIDENIAEYLLNDEMNVWQLLEDCFCYTDFKLDLKIKWNAFKTVKVIDDIMILEISSNVASNFILEKHEVGNENFEKIIAFVETKIKRDGIL